MSTERVHIVVSYGRSSVMCPPWEVETDSIRHPLPPVVGSGFVGVSPYPTAKKTPARGLSELTLTPLQKNLQYPKNEARSPEGFLINQSVVDFSIFLYNIRM